MSRIIFHIDVNSAFLSWTAVEKLKNGSDVDIREIPAIIGGDEASRHGIVLAKSVSARKYGVTTGEPVAAALRKCANLVMEPPDHQMYREYSRQGHEQDAHGLRFLPEKRVLGPPSSLLLRNNKVCHPL